MIKKNNRQGCTQENKNAIYNTVMLNSFQHLHLNHPLCKTEQILNQVQDDFREHSRLRHWAMTSLFNNGMTSSGFTLIELLVVILIIGILSAVALPQYQKAVGKAQATEVLTFLRNASQVADLFVLENGFTENDFTVNPGDLDLHAQIENMQKDFTVIFDCDATVCQILLVSKNDKWGDIGYWRESSSSKWKGSCIAGISPAGDALCEYLHQHLGFTLM